MTNQYFFQTLADAEQHVTAADSATAEQLQHYRTLAIQSPVHTINAQTWRLLATRTGNVYYRE